MGGMYSNYSVLKMLTSRSSKGTLFREIIHVCQIKEMVENNYWSPITYEIYDFDTQSLVYNTTKAEYTDESVKKVYEDQQIEQKIIDKINETDRKSILVFVPSVEQAKTLASKIPGAKAVYGDMPPKERAQVLEDFKALKLRVVVNVNVLSVGFDHPELDFIISGRSTASLSWWYQAAGRGTRIHKNKENLLICDFAGNVPRFGKIEELEYVYEGKEWKLYGEHGYLLTGIPIDEIGKHTRQTQEQIFIEKEKIAEQKATGLIPFGKFKGKKVSDTPLWWRQWMLKNFDFNTETMYLKEQILKL